MRIKFSRQEMDSTVRENKNVENEIFSSRNKVYIYICIYIRENKNAENEIFSSRNNVYEVYIYVYIIKMLKIKFSHHNICICLRGI